MVRAMVELDRTRRLFHHKAFDMVYTAIDGHNTPGKLANKLTHQQTLAAIQHTHTHTYL